MRWPPEEKCFVVKHIVMTLGNRQLSDHPTFCFANAGAYNRLDPDMNNPLEAIFCQLRQTADFAGTDFSDVNACSTDGDKGLHAVVRWGDLASAKSLLMRAST